MAGLAEAEELFPGAGVVQEVGGDDQVDRLRRFEGGGVLAEIGAAERGSPLLLLGQPDHLGGDVDAC